MPFSADSAWERTRSLTTFPHHLDEYYVNLLREYEITVVACGNAACKLRREFRFATEKPEIDVYNTFVDDFAKSGG